MSATRNQTAEIAILFSAEERNTELREEVRLGLTSTPKELQPKWFYDERGSELFDAITRLPEYYLTRAERSILERHAGEIAAMTDATTLIELGSGTSDKTRILLDALAPRRFVPFDVSEETLRASAQSLAREYPALKVLAVVGDFEYHLPLLPANGRRLLAFLGSTIGNLPPTQRARFLNDVAATLGDGDTFLLGVDLVKSPARLVAAYDDPAGVTSEFNLNVLRVLNRELCGDFDVSAFEHVAHWNAEAEWMEMFVRSLRQQTVRLEALELEVAFDAGELMRTEISAKFHLRRLANELEAAGLAVQRCWTDEAGDFALLLAWATQVADRSDRDSRWPLAEDLLPKSPTAFGLPRYRADRVEPPVGLTITATVSASAKHGLPVDVPPERDSPAWDVAGQPHGAAAAEIIVGAGKGVDAVVMRAVGEGAELVEEVVAVATADEPEQAVLGAWGT